MAAAVAALSLVVPAGGQAPQAPTFRSGVALVTVDVAVFDDSGRPVPGLGADAFEVRLDGRVQPVRLVSYLEARGALTPASPAERPAPPVWDGRKGRQTASNAGVVEARAAAGEDRVFVILVDDLSIPPTRGQRLLNAAQHFVTALPASDPVGLVRSSNSLDALNPTLDRAAIIAALKKTAGTLGELTALQPQGASASTEAGPDGFVGVSRALDIDAGLIEPLKLAIAQGCFNGDRSAVDGQVLDVLVAQNSCASQVRQQARQTASLAKRLTTLQLDGFVAAIKAMGRSTGIRHLVIVSDGLAVGRDVQQLRPLADAAAAAGVQVSVLMEEHDMSLADEGRTGVSDRGQVDTGAPQRRLEDQRMYMDGLQSATSLVGGQFYRVVGDPVPFFERVRTASAAIYRLGIEPPAGLPPGRAIAVEAKVLRPNVSVFVNRRALVPAPAPPTPPKPVSVEDRLKDVMASGQQLGAVPLEIATFVRRAAGAGQVELTINLGIAATATGPIRGPLVAMFGLAPASGAGGEMPSGRRVIDSAGADGTFSGTFALPVAQAQYRLRVAVADAEGAVGSLETELDTSLPSIGPFSASDLLVAWVDDAGRAQLMALEPLPTAATGIRADLELYPPASGVSLDSVQVELSVTKAGDTEPADERIVTPRDAQGVWRASAEFPAEAFEAGRYTLRARVIVGDKAVGSAVAVFTKR